MVSQKNSKIEKVFCLFVYFEIKKISLESFDNLITKYFQNIHLYFFSQTICFKLQSL